MKLNDIQLEAFNELKKSNGWGIVSEIANQIILSECSLDDIDEKLNAEEYKAESIGRKIAKRMFTQVFDEVKYLDKQIEQKKKDLS